MSIGDYIREKAQREVREEIIQKVRNVENLWTLITIANEIDKVLAEGQEQVS